jgi:hypothetical protein
MDMFGQDFKMNMRGETSLNSYYGASVSVGCLLILLAYACIRSHIFLQKSDTLNSEIIVQDFFNENLIYSEQA